MDDHFLTIVDHDLIMVTIVVVVVDGKPWFDSFALVYYGLTIIVMYQLC